MPRQDGPSEPDPAVTQKEDENVDEVKQLGIASLSVTDRSVLSLPLRPGYATLGKAIELYANHFPIVLDLKIDIYRYNVDIDPEEKVIRKKQRIFEILLTDGYLGVLPNPPASNFENMLIADQELDLNGGISQVFEIEFYNRGERKPSPARDSNLKAKDRNAFKVTVTYKGVVQTDRLMQDIQAGPTKPGYEDTQQTLDALNSALTINAKLNTEIVSTCQNSKFYLTNGESSDLGDGVVALKGYYARIHTSTLRLLVNANICTSAFYQEGNLYDLMKAYKRRPDGSYQLGSERIPALELFIQGPRVKTQYTKDEKTGELLTKERSVFGFSHKPEQPVENGDARQISFIVEKWGNMEFNVAQYFQKEYGHKTWPDMPIVNLGNRERPLWVPAELCTILPGQPFRKRLDPDQTAKMTKCGVMRPAESAGHIVNSVPDILGIESGRQNLEAYGLKMGTKMVTVPGRLLKAPTVKLRTTSGPPMPVQFSKGCWNMAGKKFSVPICLKEWSYLVLDDTSRSAGRISTKITGPIVEEFRSGLRKCGVETVNPFANGLTKDLDLGGAEKTIDQVIEDAMRLVASKPVKMLVVFLPNDNAFVYSRIKLWSEAMAGFHTVCIQASRLKLQNSYANAYRTQYFANVAMKVNLKAGGKNQTLSVPDLGPLQPEKTMLVGVDVTHPSKGSLLKAPSVAGVVANVDKEYAQWPASIRLHKGGQEMVEELKLMFKERLNTWRKYNDDKLPENIVIYRDGVSDSQYGQVLRDELPQIKEACEEVYPANSPQPRMAIIVVGKRHHTRLYITDSRDADMRGNPGNGTVVDRAITSHRGWDCFLKAHECIQGTAKPAHYVVIYNQFKEFEDVDTLYAFVSSLHILSLPALLGICSEDVLTRSNIQINNLCYLFGRASTPVSVCPPAYYADLACERGRNYLYKVYNPSNEDRANEVEYNPNNIEWNWRRGVHGNLIDSIWYI